MSAAVALLLPACEGCNFGTDAAGNELPPEYALGITIRETYPSCDGTNTAKVINVLGDALEIIGGDASAGAECGHVERELFTSTVLGPLVESFKSWVAVGDEGPFFTDAALCMLRDLRHGPVRAVASANVLVGKLRAEQEIGYLDFDPAGKQMRGYQKLRFCAPVVGCIDAHLHEFEALATQTQIGVSNLDADGRAIESAHGLVWHTEESSQHFNASLPAILVPTPVGPISVTPELAYRAGVQAHMAPFASEEITRSGADPNTSVVDVFGRYLGTLATAEIPSEQFRGWTSQIAVGARGVADDTAVWNPADARRPDLDLGVPRNAGERAPSLSLTALARIAYDPTEFLPTALLTFAPIRIEKAELFIEPSLQGRFTGQMDVRFREWVGGPDPDGPLRETSLDITAAASARAAFHVRTGLDLLIKAGVGPFEITILDLSPRVDFDIASSEDTATLERPARAAHDFPSSNGQSPVQSFHGGPEVLDGCFDVVPESQPVPEPSYEPGDPNDLLAAAVFPCNICMAWSQAEVLDPETGMTHTLPAGSEKVAVSADTSSYTCNATHAGCYDLCTLNPATGALEIKYNAEALAQEPGLSCQDPPH